MTQPDLDTVLDFDEPWELGDPPLDEKMVGDLVRQRRALSERIASTRALFLAELERINDRLAEVVGPLEAHVDMIDTSITQWMRANVEEGGPKSLTLPHGTIRSTAGRARLVITDEGAALAYMAEDELLANLLRTTVTLDKAATKDHIADTGEVIPGCTLEVGDRTVKVTHDF